jgi:hypothetical protein
MTDALLVLPRPALELTVTELFFAPPHVPTTFTEIAHSVPAGSVPLERLTLLFPAPMVTVPPLHSSPVNPLGVATTRPGGRLSVKLTFVRPVLRLGLPIAKVNEVEPFNGIELAPNDLVICAGEVAAAAGALNTSEQLTANDMAPAVQARRPSNLRSETFIPQAP